MNSYQLSHLPTLIDQLAPNCPRCDSSDTKFCYYNNYSLTQPRYLCKSCKRYWTKGGALRDVPIGGGCRKKRRSKSTRHKSCNDQTHGNSFRPDLSLDGMALVNNHTSSSSSEGSCIDLAELYVKYVSSDNSCEPTRKSLKTQEDFLVDEVDEYFTMNASGLDHMFLSLEDGSYSNEEFGTVSVIDHHCLVSYDEDAMRRDWNACDQSNYLEVIDHQA